MQVWDTESGVCYLTLHGHTDWVRGADFSQTQKLLVTASWDRRVTFWKYKVLSAIFLLLLSTFFMARIDVHINMIPMPLA